AATGKGFAIGSAALTALALLAAYIEEVRVGFDRWGEASVSEQADPGFYKLSRQFVVEVGEDGRRSGWLVDPEDASDPRLMEDWRKVDFSKGPVAVPQDLLTRETIGDQEALTFAKTRAMLTSVKTATLPDFMRYYDVTLMNPKVLVGAFLGSMAVFVFCAMTMKAVGRAAKGMVEEVRRQFREKPGIMQGTDLPDYAAPVAISTKAAQREMVVPSLLALAVPVVVGLLLGVGGVMGLLTGALTTGFCVAVFMSNSGGAWDNAKKYIEAGHHGGKGTDPHKAAVV